MKTKTLDYIDFDRVNTLLEDFNKLTGFVTAILDLEGNILSKSGWRNICTKFHRVNPLTKKNCIASDTILANKAKSADFNAYKCYNGLYDVAVPIVIENEHVANLFTGQFFYEKPDVSYFKDQARTYGFDEKKYLKALEDVPIVTEKRVKEVIKYLLSITQIIIDLTSDKIKQENSKILFESSLESPKDIFIRAVDKNYRYLYFNQAQKKLMKSIYNKEIEIGMHIDELGTSDISKVTSKDNYDLALSGISHTKIQKYGENQVKYFETFYNPIYDIDDKVIGATAYTKDITEITNMNNQLAESENRYIQLIKNLEAGIIVHKNDTSIIYANKKAEQLLGVANGALINKKMRSNYFNFVDSNFNRINPEDYPINKIIKNKTPLKNYVVGIKQDNKNKLIWVSINGIPIFDSDNHIKEIVISFTDISDEKSKQDEIAYLINHDFLTGLYNRRFFVEKYSDLDKPTNFPLGIVMIDLNGLKIINDAFGHQTGDDALRKISSILEKSFRKQDIICRIGGDEFAIILPHITKDKIESIREYIMNECKKNSVNNITLSLAMGYQIKTSESNMDADEILKSAENYMYKHKLEEGIRVRNHAINSILQTLNKKHEFENIHSKKVSQFCKEIGHALGLKDEDIKELELAGLYHDIGKISIPDYILAKPDKLTKEEFEIIKNHPEISYQILRAADEYSELAIHALHHHERWDGKGYPSGQKHEEIPLFSRIICIAEAFEAMTAYRPYKEKMSIDQAIEEIKRCSGKQFDPNISKLFIELLQIQKNDE
jgi:diguanylate cyclase (GGDEF)-like protein/PAS domain S-box-containing protein